MVACTEYPNYDPKTVISMTPIAGCVHIRIFAHHSFPKNVLICYPDSTEASALFSLGIVLHSFRGILQYSNYLFPDISFDHILRYFASSKLLTSRNILRRAWLIFCCIHPESVSLFPKDHRAVFSRFQFGLLFSQFLVSDFPKNHCLLFYRGRRCWCFQQGSYILPEGNLY